MNYTEEIDDKAVEYIREVKKLGGVLSYGNNNHRFLIQTESNKWDEGRKLSWRLNLMKNIEVGEGSYFKVEISKKGNNVLSQFDALQALQLTNKE